MRGELDIIADMLTAVEGGASKYSIIQKSRLNNDEFDKYIQILLQSGLVDAFPIVDLRHIDGIKSRHRVFYHISKTGKLFLTLYRQLLNWSGEKWLDRCV